MSRRRLHAGAAWFAGGEITFAIGAILAGALLPRLLARTSAAQTIPGTMFVFLVGLLVIILVPYPLIYLGAGALLGFGNAGCRVARSALLMHIVPATVMGRVGVFYSVLDRVLRTGLVMAMAIIDLHGPAAGFLVLLALLVFALVGVLQSRPALRESTPSTAIG